MKGSRKEKLHHLFKELGFQSLLDKLGQDLVPEDMTELEDIEFEMVEQINEEIFAEHNFFYVEVLEDNYHYADIIGFSLVNAKGHFFISTAKSTGVIRI